MNTFRTASLFSLASPKEERESRQCQARRHRNICSHPVWFVILRLPHVVAIFNYGRIPTRYRQLSNNIAGKPRNLRHRLRGRIARQKPKSLI